ncbi:MAG: sterol desaturase family protein [Alphaproteobacteria bacterium]|nr:sterol desaturase family protein [Alphaproteobacteria bacterium]
MEAALRLGMFLALLAAMALWEHVAPRRALDQDRRHRWLVNLGLAVIDTLAVRLMGLATAYAVATLAEARGFGLLTLVAWPAVAETLLAVLVLDLALYFQHVMSHALPAFWRLHRVHHSDLDFDTSTGVRFHPLEIMISMLYKGLLVAAIGASPAAVIAFEIILSGTSLFNHGNVRLPEAAEPWLRRLVVTPDMHRVHHSSRVAETNSNFGFALSCWDRLFGTYRAAAAGGPLSQRIGLAEYPDPAALGLVGLLLLPFRGGPGGTSLRRDPE